MRSCALRLTTARMSYPSWGSGQRSSAPMRLRRRGERESGSGRGSPRGARRPLLRGRRPGRCSGLQQGCATALGRWPRCRRRNKSGWSGSASGCAARRARRGGRSRPHRGAAPPPSRARTERRWSRVRSARRSCECPRGARGPRSALHAHTRGLRTGPPRQRIGPRRPRQGSGGWLSAPSAPRGSGCRAARKAWSTARHAPTDSQRQSKRHQQPRKPRCLRRRLPGGCLAASQTSSRARGRRSRR
mmetsp:Transcript_41650/g.98832  ORF Transcript_41650/g.98832 Transcript_41650/m.98832 type:complete len:245 (-) Transcript_41650:183-917(-)